MHTRSTDKIFGRIHENWQRVTFREGNQVCKNGWEGDLISIMYLSLLDYFIRWIDNTPFKMVG